MGAEAIPEGAVDLWIWGLASGNQTFSISHLSTGAILATFWLPVWRHHVNVSGTSELHGGKSCLRKLNEFQHESLKAYTKPSAGRLV
jgi:hypothetical protein